MATRDFIFEFNAQGLYFPCNGIGMSKYCPEFLQNYIMDSTFYRFLPDTNIVFKYQINDIVLIYPLGIGKIVFYVKSDNIRALYKHDLQTNKIDKIEFDYDISGFLFSMNKRFIAIISNNSNKTFIYDLENIVKKEPLLELPKVWGTPHFSDNFKYIIANSNEGYYSKQVCYQLNLESSNVREESNINNRFSLSPNPANNSLNIIKTNEIPIINIEIYNLRAELIAEYKDINSNNFSLSVSKYPNGIYYVKVDGISKMFVIAR
jgi:hypothetical protein